MCIEDINKLRNVRRCYMSSNKNSNSVFHKRMSDSHMFPRMNDDMFNEMVRASGLEPININMLTRVKSDLCGIVSKDKNTEEDWNLLLIKFGIIDKEVTQISIKLEIISYKETDNG